MTDVERMNELLAAVGSEHRVFSGGTLTGSIVVLCEALPAYIARVVEREVERRIAEEGRK